MPAVNEDFHSLGVINRNPIMELLLVSSPILGSSSVHPILTCPVRANPTLSYPNMSCSVLS